MPTAEKMVSMTVFKNDDNDESRPNLWSRMERRLWIASLFLGCATLYATRTVMPLCVVALGKELGWTKKESGTVLSAFFWGYTMTQVAGGYLSDRVGGENVILAAAVGWSLLTFWTPFLTYLYTDKETVLTVVVVIRVLLGALQGVHYPSMSSLLSQKIPESERGFSFATVAAGSHFGTLICGSLGSILLEQYGWQSAFYVVGLLGMVWLLYLRYYLISKQRRKAMVLSLKDIAPPPTNNNTPVPWLKLFRKAAFWSIIIGHLCENNAFFILLSWLPTYFRENFPGAKGWVFNVVPWVVSIPASILGGLMADYLVSKGYSVTFVRKVSATIALAGVAFFLFIISYTTSYAGALFCMAASIACCGFHGSGILVNPQDIAPQFAGSVFGVMNMAGAIPGFVGVYIAGHVLEVTKSWAVVFNQTAVVSLIGWVVYLVFGTGKKII